MHRKNRLAFLSLILLLGCSSWANAQRDEWRTMYPAWYEVPPPSHEVGPGTNAYWHDPNLGWREDADCADYGPSDLGCGPLWIGRVDGLFLFRDPKGHQDYQTLGPSGSTVLSSSNFDTEFEAGFRATLGRSLGDWYRIEGTYFGTYSYGDTQAFRNDDANAGGGNGDLFSPFGNFGNPAALAGVDFNNFASIAFTSQLTNAELNLRRRILARPGRWEASFLVGVRYIDLDESFRYQTVSTTGGASNVDYQINTTNSLIGAQLGLLTQYLIRPRMWIDFDMKGGIYANDAGLNQSFDLSGAVNAGADQLDRTAFVGELSLQFNYNFCRIATFYAGYNAFWMTGVALAEDNFSTNLPLLQLGPAQLNHRGETVYHGPNIGVLLAY